MNGNQSHIIKIGSYFFWGLGFLVFPMWIISIIGTDFFGHNKSFYLTQASEICAICGFSLYALTFVLSSRLKWLETFFGGLDKIYQTHHKMGKVAFFLILSHPILLALRWIPNNISKVYWYLFPVHRHLAVNLGSLAWWGLIILLFLTLVFKLPYDKWKISHKFMGAVFIFAVLHTFLMKGLVVENPYLLTYFTSLSFLAIAAILYKTILFSFIIKHYFYLVEKIDRLNDKVVEITLVPEHEKLTFIPGQYCFFSFINTHFTREAHPFTICSTPKSEKIQIVVKSLGDFTLKLYRTLEPNILVSLEGPYGRFNYRLGKKDQIWISGGVGIAPFISWLRSMQDDNSQDQWNINFYYCVNTRDEIIYFDEFKKLEKENHKLYIHLISANEEGFLKTADIPDIQTKEIYICGPKAMRRSLLKQFRDLHIPKKQIHYEDFDFL